MFHKKCSGNSSIGAGEDTFDTQNLKCKTNQELLDEIEMIISTGSDQDMDTDKIEQYLAILQERAPVMENYSADAELNRLKDDHPLLFDEEAVPVDTSSKSYIKRFRNRVNGRKPARLMLTVQIFVAVMLCLVITANAFAINPIQEFLKWAQGVIQVYSNPSGDMELPADNPSGYRSLKDALTANDIENDKCPNWVPQDYTLMEVSVRDSEEIIHCTAIYESSRGELLIRVTKYSNNADWSITEEREESGYTYTHNEREYYIVSNYEQSKAIWQIGQSIYTISGQLSEAELKDMINSIT